MNVIDNFINSLENGELKCMVCGYTFSLDDIDLDESHSIVSLGVENLYLKCRICGLEYPVTLFMREVEDEVGIRRIA